MLQGDGAAFSEDEVGGVWALPHPTTAAAAVTDTSALKASGAAPSSSSPLAPLQQHDGDEASGRGVPVNRILHRARSDTPGMDENRESALDAVVRKDVVAADHGAPDAQGGVTSPLMRAAGPSGPGSTDAHVDLDHNACRKSRDDSSPHQQQPQQRHQADIVCQPRLANLPSASPAAMQAAAPEDELLGNSHGAVAVARSSSTRSRSGNHSRGPPAASVMDAPAHAAAVAAAVPTASLIAALASSAVEEEVLFPRELARPASQDSISFSIRSSSSSSSSQVGEDKPDQASPVAAADEAACRAAAASEEQQLQQLLREDNNHNGGDLPLYPSTDPADRNVNASESIRSSPTAVTLWGVHRDLRRKRIKKVSHYILGSLLGEGTYGVVRDCIDINTDNVNRRFQRCAIKIVNGTFARADMPAIFGHRVNGNSNKDGGGLPSPDPPASSDVLAPLRGMLRRTSGSGHGGGMRDHHGGERRRQDVFQREMRNLQRFHCKNIIRALDSFTRYNKEYVVLPIAICSVQQLVRQLMRTRWREAVRTWRRRQRKALSKQMRAAAAAAGVAGGEGNAAKAPPRGLPAVPSAADSLNLDDLTFMMADASDFDDEESEASSETEDDADTATTTTTAATSTNAHTGHNTSQHRDGSAAMGHRNGGSNGARHVDVSRRKLNVAAVAYDGEDDQRSSGSLSDHDDDARSGTWGLTGRRGQQATSATNAGHTSHDRRRGLPRVPSTRSNSSTTTTTTRTIDSYENGNNSSNDARGAQRCQQRGGEDEASDLSSCGVHHSSANSNCIHVMSATPTERDGDVLEQHPRPPGGAEGTAGKRSGAAAVPTTEKPKRRTAISPNGIPVDDSRPHLTYPMCSTTLLKGIFYQVISGVNYLHQQQLAHNDIKPSNVLLFEDGSVKLGDLGSVSEVYNDQGTPLCASPELCKYFYGAATPPSSFSKSTEAVGRDAARPSDMWCCGLLLYFLITGKPGPLPVQLRYFQSLHSKQSRTNTTRDQQCCGAAGQEDSTAGVPSRCSFAPPPIVTRYQLYREIASHTEPVDLSELPDMIPPDLGDDAAAGGVATDNEGGQSPHSSPTSPFSKNSVRHLLAGLLELNPQRRLTAEQALHHPWLCMTFRVKPNNKEDHEGNGSKRTGKQSKKRSSPTPQNGQDNRTSNGSSNASPAIARKAPSKQAMEDAIQRDVARRVMESRHVQRMLLRDRQRHLQFVADCCNMLNLSIPPEIIRVQPAEPYREDDGAPAANTRIGAGVSTPPASRATTWQQRNVAAAAMVGGGRNNPRVSSMIRANSNTNVQGPNSSHTHHYTPPNSNAGAVTGTVLQSAMMPAVMPPACVDTELFLPHSEEDYYEQKSGKSEFDVRVLRRKPLLMAQLDEYFHNVVLVQCGYRTGPDPNYQAMRVRAVPIEDEIGSGRGGRRRGGSGSSRGVTQQPAVLILPGASNTAYRRSPSAVVTEIVTLDTIHSTEGAFPAAATAGHDASGLVEDVWGAGPRHQPRVRVNEDGNVVSAAGNYAITTVDLATAAVAAGCVVGNVSHRMNPISANVANSHDGGAAAAAAAASSATASRSSQRDATSLPAQAAAGPSSKNSNNSKHSRSSGAARPAVSASASSNNNSSGGNNRHSSVDTMDTQEVMGTVVVNAARASATPGRSRRDAGRGNNNSSRSPRDASESASEAEQNVAMRESSKCLCGLM